MFNRWTSDTCVVVAHTSIFKNMPINNNTCSMSNLSHRRELSPFTSPLSKLLSINFPKEE